LSGTVVLRKKWPVIGRHEQAATWMQIWADLGRAPRTIDAYARGLAEYLLMCEREGVDPGAANRPLPDRGERPQPRDHRRDPDGQQAGQRMPPPALLPGVRDLGEEIERVLALRAAGIGEDVIDGRASLVAGDGERENFHRSARALPARPRTRRTAGHSVNS
jgi:hypothetical protein